VPLRAKTAIQRPKAQRRLCRRAGSGVPLLYLPSPPGMYAALFREAKAGIPLHPLTRADRAI